MADPTIDFETLLAFASGELTAPEAERVREYLREHPVHAESVRIYQMARLAVAGDDGVEPTPTAIKRARAVFRLQAASSGMGWLEAVDRLVGRLLFDSRLQPAALRGTATEDRINFTFEAESLEVDVQAERLMDESARGSVRWRMIGQISRTTDGNRIESGCPVALTAAGSLGPTAQATTESTGTFVLEAADGMHDLHIGLPEGTLVLPGINLE